MFSSRYCLLVSNYSRIAKCINRYESEVCKSDFSKSDHSESKDKKGEGIKCAVCRAYPCECSPSAPTMYDKRKYGHNLPCDNATPPFETLPNLPTGIFRYTMGEILGRGADKCSFYQNPEYFSYHHMTFYDLHMLLRCYRSPCAESGRKL